MLTDPSCFTHGIRRIANVTLGVPPDPNSAAIISAVQFYIDYYEPRYLCDMFGDEKGRELMRYIHDARNTAMQTDPVKDELCDLLKEPCADYILFHIIRDTASETTITGEVRIKTADIAVSPIRKQVNVWNDMVYTHRQIQGWLEKNIPHLGIRQDMLTRINTLNI